MPRVSRVLGLDIGTRTGYALVEGDKIVRTGVRDFSIKSNEHIGKRGIMFYNFLLTFGQLDEIYYEKIHFVPKGFSADGGELYKGFLMLVNMYAAGYGIPTYGIWPGTLKKAFTGNGAADKELMCATAHLLGWKGGSVGTAQCHDEADGIALVVTQMREKYNINLKF